MQSIHQSLRNWKSSLYWKILSSARPRSQRLMMSSMLNPVRLGWAAAGDGCGCADGRPLDVEACGGEISGGEPIRFPGAPTTGGCIGIGSWGELATSGEMVGGIMSSSGGFSSGRFRCRPKMPMLRDSDGRYGSPSGPIGRLRRGIELKKFGVR